MTVLFADLVGFTARAESLDPEDVEAILRPYHERLRDELERHSGTVEKFIGDAVMAVFGAPTAHEDDPERAVRAAVAIRDGIRGDGTLQVRIGIATGEALVSLDARPSEGQGMVAGDVVNTAARLQTAAAVNTVIVGEATYRASERAIEFRAGEPVEAKGKTEPIPVWEAVQARASYGVDTPQDGGAPLVGRRRELEALTGALARTREELVPQLVTLVGVPGIGKSRLAAELFAAVEAERDLISWRQGRSLPYGEGVSFWALGEMVKSQAGILETDPADHAAAKIRDAVAAAVDSEAEVEWVERHLRVLVGLGGGDATRDASAEAYGAWRRFFEGLADTRPLVLVFEDLHWADDGLLDFIDHLIDWASGVALLVVGTARPELLARRREWGGGKSNATTLSLAPLSRDDTAQLLHALLDRSVLPAETQAALLERAGGNPLYAEEFVRLFAERGELEGAHAVPDSVQGLIAARLDQLPAGEKEVIQDASIVGKVFWPSSLASISGRDPGEAAEALHRLERKEFIRRERRSAVAGDAQYAFLHVLVRDVAYGQIPRAARAAKHRAAADWIESLGRHEDAAEMLAHHYASALDYSRAAGLSTDELTGRARLALRDAGSRAEALHAFKTASHFFMAALDVWPAGDAERPYLLLQAGRNLLRAEIRGEELLAEARDGLLALGDVEGAVEAEAILGHNRWFRGDPTEAIETLERAVSLVADRPPSRAKAQAFQELSRLHMVGGRPDRAIELGRHAAAMAEELGLDFVRGEALNNIGTARAFDGDPGGVDDLDASIAIAERLNAPMALARALVNRADVAMSYGNLGAGFGLLARARQVAVGDEFQTFWLQGELVTEHFFRGRWDEAVHASSEFLTATQAAGHYLGPTARAFRAKISLARGDEAAALSDTETGLRTARSVGDPQVLKPVIAARAFVLAETGAAEAAEELIAEVQDSRHLEPTTLVDSAWIQLARGRRSELAAVVARQGLATAWTEAAAAIADGRLEEAADRFADIGSLPDEAYTRLRAAEQLVRRGRRVEADPQLQRALAFYRSVGATRYVREGEALLAATA